jgi:hypothetical protein
MKNGKRKILDLGLLRLEGDGMLAEVDSGLTGTGPDTSGDVVCRECVAPGER